MGHVQQSAPARSSTGLSHDERLRLLAKYSREGSRSLYRIAEIYDALAQEPGFNYDDLAKTMRERYGTDVHSEAGVSKLRSMHRKYRLELGLTPEQLEGISPYKLYHLQTVVNLHNGNIDKWLGYARIMSRDELVDKAYGRPHETPKFKLLNVEENVHVQYKEARNRMARAAGLQKISDTEFLEFMSMLIATSDIPTLRELWSRNH